MVQLINKIQNAKLIHLIVLCLSIIPPIVLLVFMNHFGANIPRADHGWESTSRVVEFLNGDMKISTLINPVGGHVMIFPLLQDIAFAYFTDWNIDIEIYIIFIVASLLFINIIVIGFKTIDRTQALLILPLFSMIIFAVQHDFVWLMPLVNGNYWAILLLLISINIVIYDRHNRFFVLIVLSILGTLATFFGYSGFIVFASMGLITMWRWIKRPFFIIIWTIISISVILIYSYFVGLIGNEFNTLAGTARTNVDYPNFMELIRYVLGFLGNNFFTGTWNYHRSVWIGLFGTVFLLTNIVYLLRFKQAYNFLKIWSGIASYSIASGMLLALTRYSVYREGPNAAMFVWYKSFAMLFWIAYFATIAKVNETRQQSTTIYNSMLISSNIIFTTFLIVLYIFSNYEAVIDQKQYTYKRLEENCFVQYLFIQDAEKVMENGCRVIGADYVNSLSIYELALFANHPKLNIMPSFYNPNTSVIVETSNGWINYHIQKWLLDGLDEKNILHLSQLDMVNHPQMGNVVFVKPQQFYTENIDERIESFLDDKISFWYVYNAQDELGEIRKTELSQTYLHYDLQYKTAEGSQINMIYFVLPPRKEIATVSFGDSIELIDIRLVGSFEPCNRVDVITYWRAEPPIQMGYGYSGTLVLTNGSDSNPLVRVDKQLSVQQTHLWDTEKVYVDERSMTIPCDQEQDFNIGFGIYDYQDPNNLLEIKDNQSHQINGMLDILSFLNAHQQNPVQATS